jgi:hypothetical protein
VSYLIAQFKKAVAQLAKEKGERQRKSATVVGAPPPPVRQLQGPGALPKRR